MAKAKKAKAKRGRPSDFDPLFCEQAEKLCKLLNADDKQLAAFFEKDVATINRWKLKHAEFRASIKRGKAVADLDVADKLHERALGYEWIEEVPIKLKTVTYENGKRAKEEERIEIAHVRKRLPADVTAQIFWLKNRQSETWRDRHEVTGKNGKDLIPIINVTIGAGGNLSLSARPQSSPQTG